MTAVEKFNVCWACWRTCPSFGGPYVRQQWVETRNAVANAVCPTYDEGVTFRTLSERDNWLEQDNPFKDDPCPSPYIQLNKTPVTT